MRRPPDIPPVPGVFVVLHEPSKHAYVHATNNLKERAAIWSSHFNAIKRDPAKTIPVRNWPVHPPAEWEFRFVTDPAFTIAIVQDAMVKAGWKIIPSRRATRAKTYQVAYPDGQTHVDTLLGHCRRLGLKHWGAVYKRVERGETPEQALELVERVKPDMREHKIAQMKVRILTDDGEGLLTYDEAVMMRPQLGDVRRKLLAWSRRNPGVVQIKLSQIPV